MSASNGGPGGSRATANGRRPRKEGTLLRVDSLRSGYGPLEAVTEASVEVRSGEIVALLGHNGAGKTTTLKSVVGLQPVWGGMVEFEGRDVTDDPVATHVSRGMCFVPEDGFVFPHLSVSENLEVAAHGVPKEDAGARRREVYEILPILRDREDQAAGTLSGGEKRMLSIGMAVMAGPRLLLLDEPSLGLAPVLVERVLGLVERLAREKALSVLMVEQNVEQALAIAERVYVMRAGRVILHETAEAMRARDQWWDLF